MVNKKNIEKSAEDIMRTFQETNSSASFEELVNYFKVPLLNYIYRFLGDRDLAEDVLQDTFIRVYRKKDLYNGQAKVSTWIYTIAGNIAKSHIAQKGKYHHISVHDYDGDEQGFEIVSTDPQPDRIVDAGIKEAYIQKALLKVPDVYREAIILRDVQEFSYEEIAEMLDITIGTVKSRINRARAILQQALKPLLQDDK